MQQLFLKGEKMNERRQKQLGSLKKWLGDNWGYPDSQISINETKEEKNLSDKDLKTQARNTQKIIFRGKNILIQVRVEKYLFQETVLINGTVLQSQENKAYQ